MAFGHSSQVLLTSCLPFCLHQGCSGAVIRLYLSCVSFSLMKSKSSGSPSFSPHFSLRVTSAGGSSVPPVSPSGAATLSSRGSSPDWLLSCHLSVCPSTSGPLSAGVCPCGPPLGWGRREPPSRSS